MIMKSSFPIKPIVVSVVSYFTAVLFIYAATSKLLDFENFQVQLAQSPLLSAFAGWLPVFVPVAEYVLALGLLVPRFRFIALLASLHLMTLFSVYIYIILHYSAFVPCSCGGVLEKMSWNQHLVFNVLVSGLLLYSLLVVPLLHQKVMSLKFRMLVGFISLFSAVVLLFFLYSRSETMMHERNPFIRRFPHHPVRLLHELDLKLNSYYIAGMSGSSIYLGNTTSALHLKIVDTTLSLVRERELVLSDPDLLFKRPQLVVSDTLVYLIDGSVPTVLSGSIDDFILSTNITHAYFSLAVPVAANRFAIRARSSSTNENVLGLLSVGNSSAVALKPLLLQKQVDGIFDTDGVLLYNKSLEKVIYVYYYRNPFLVLDTALQLEDTGKTIDTIGNVSFKIQKLEHQNATTFSQPPLLVNRTAVTDGAYLYVQSQIIGRFEPKSSWNTSAVIDVYHLPTKTYRYSFRIANKGSAALSDFHIYGNKVIGLIGTTLVVYELDLAAFKD